MTANPQALDVTVSRGCLPADRLNPTARDDHFTAITLQFDSSEVNSIEVAIHDEPTQDGTRLFLNAESGTLSGSDLRKLRAFFATDPRIQELCDLCKDEDL